ncbi:TfoX/Sxy family protein [Ideonella sp. A 288]|uniref:TfoX/Sxy family protein n=1 Tax=Ideonella sp. A 288 TaxID=1962181 RepID=UPI000B4B0000|nr:TfoX/Sxy family protein [Ideonella sp. A 288]
MSSSAEFVAHCMDLLAAQGRPRARRMFGGHGLYIDDLFVALIIEERLYLKADEQARPAFEQAGSEPFGYATRNGRRTVLAYWSVPDDAMESPALMQPWARLAMASALRAANAKHPAPQAKAAAARRQARASPRRG